MKKSKEAMPIQVRFNAAIRSDGELVRITIVQNGQEVCLTIQQAKSLLEQIKQRLERWEKP